MECATRAIPARPPENPARRGADRAGEAIARCQIGLAFGPVNNNVIEIDGEIGIWGIGEIEEEQILAVNVARGPVRGIGRGRIVIRRARLRKRVRRHPPPHGLDLRQRFGRVCEHRHLNCVIGIRAEHLLRDAAGHRDHAGRHDKIEIRAALAIGGTCAGQFRRWRLGVDRPPDAPHHRVTQLARANGAPETATRMRFVGHRPFKRGDCVNDDAGLALNHAEQAIQMADLGVEPGRHGGIQRHLVLSGGVRRISGGFVPQSQKTPHDDDVIDIGRGGAGVSDTRKFVDRYIHHGSGKRRELLPQQTPGQVERRRTLAGTIAMP